MSRSDYAHWNEEADIIWWEEEGKHYDSEADPDRYEDDYESYYDFEEDEDEDNHEPRPT